jgi:hypothetical protein
MPTSVHSTGTVGRGFSGRHPLAANQPQPAETQPPDIPEAHRTTGGGDLFRSGAAGVSRGDDGSGTDAGNAMDRNAMLLKNFEHARMSDAACETAPSASPMRSGCSAAACPSASRSDPLFRIGEWVLLP